MKRLSPMLALALLAVFVSISPGEEPPKDSLAQLEKAFADYCGARLVFAAKNLPEGTYHDSMPSLNDAGRMRARKPHACLMWEAHFQNPLPAIPIPLAKPDADLSLNLQPLLDTIYRRFRYEQSIHYDAELTPPLPAEESAGGQELLRTRPGS